MARGRSSGLIVLVLVLIAAGAGGYWLWHRQSTPPLIEIVHATEVRVAPEIGGRLVKVQVLKGNSVHAGDVLAELSALELTPSVEQARAALVKATANHNNVYAGMREEQRASLAAETRRRSQGCSMLSSSSPVKHIWRVPIPSRNKRWIKPKKT